MNNPTAAQKPKVLVHFHLYYHNQLNFMLKKLANICGCDWDLYVTASDINDKIIKKIKSLKPDAHILIIENIGYDIWPFIQVINKVNLNDYDFVLKTHTKNYRRKTEFFGSGYAWRNYLIDALLISKKKFRENLNIFLNNEDIGMIGSEAVLVPMGEKYSEDTYLFEDVCKKYNLNVTKGNFIAGTMFIIRAKCLEAIKNLHLTEDDFPNNQNTQGRDTIAHVIERLFSRFVEMQNFKIYGAPDEKYRFKCSFKKFLKNLFGIRNKVINNKKHKYICILGINIFIN